MTLFTPEKWTPKTPLLQKTCCMHLTLCKVLHEVCVFTYSGLKRGRYNVIYSSFSNEFFCFLNKCIHTIIECLPQVSLVLFQIQTFKRSFKNIQENKCFYLEKEFLSVNLNLIVYKLLYKAKQWSGRGKVLILYQ